MQAALKDISLARPDSEPFLICQRLLNQCHEIIFGDIVLSNAPYGSLNQLIIPGTLRKKVNTQVHPALVGIGMVLAGVPGMPQLTGITGEVAVEQGRADDSEGNKMLEIAGDPSGTLYSPQGMESISNEDEEDQSEPPSAPLTVSTGEEVSPDPFEERKLPKTAPLLRRKTIGAQTSPALPLRLKIPLKPRLSEDPFGQYDPPSPPVPVSTPSQSTPSLPSGRHPAKTGSVYALELLSRYDARSQGHLLRSHFCQSVVRPESSLSHSSFFMRYAGRVHPDSGKYQ